MESKFRNWVRTNVPPGQDGADLKDLATLKKILEQITEQRSKGGGGAAAGPPNEPPDELMLHFAKLRF